MTTRRRSWPPLCSQPMCLALLALLAAALGGCRSAPPPLTESPVALPDAASTTADPRIIFDRLHPERNASGLDLTALNAVGVIAPIDGAAQRVYAAGSGFLIDSCHVLTAEHVMYGWLGDYDAPPPLGQEVQFALGQEDGDEANLTEGLKYFYRGTVTAYGGTGRHDGRTDHSDIDWAVVTLSRSVGQIQPLALYPLDPLDESDSNWILAQHGEVGAAGFPGDHTDHDPRLAHRHLWGSFGSVMRVAFDSASGYAFLASTNPASAGTSGGPLFSRVAGRVVAVGIVQSVVGDGIHDKEVQPTLSVLITPRLLQDIGAAMRNSPCSPGNS